jgi:DNA-binding MarR family transcriptional regulator
MATDTATPDPGFDLSSFLPYRLSALSALTQRLLEVTLARGGVTIAQWRVFLCLVTKGSCTLNEVVAFTHMPQSSLSRSIAAMHERGLVRNARNPTDRRIARIEITPKGRRAFAVLTESIEAACTDAFRLNPVEEALLIRRLDELIRRLTDWRRREAGVAFADPSPAEPEARASRPRRLPVSATAPTRSPSRRARAVVRPGEPR